MESSPSHLLSLFYQYMLLSGLVILILMIAQYQFKLHMLDAQRCTCHGVEPDETCIVWLGSKNNIGSHRPPLIKRRVIANTGLNQLNLRLNFNLMLAQLFKGEVMLILR